MNLSDEYRRQFGFRNWLEILNALPPLKGTTILDLGCGVGDVAAEFVARGASVIGVDANEEFVRAAQSRQLRNADFRLQDLRSLPDLGASADGLWCSFTAAYFPELGNALTAWAKNLKDQGWIALTEIDDLFGHEPLSLRTRDLLKSYAGDALAAGRYDFQMGRKIATHLERSGFTVSKSMTVDDREFSFNGPAGPEVLEAWRARFGRMKLLRDFCGIEFEFVQEEFLRCLAQGAHRSISEVHCCIAVKDKSLAMQTMQR